MFLNPQLDVCRLDQTEKYDVQSDQSNARGVGQFQTPF